MRLTFSYWMAALCALAIVATPCSAVIKKLTPLKEVVEGTKLIFTAEVEKIDADKPSMTLQFKENLKGKFEIESLPVNLKGDSFAKKDDHAKVMLDRLAIGRKLILFATKEGKTYQVFGYLEGTWFQMQGSEDADGKAVRWAFLHCEPYFRRTFKGTTAELKDVLEKALAGKAEPPAPDEKEPAGYGPLTEKKSQLQLPNRQYTPTLFGVIPSFILVGPLAIIAAFFPGVFARLAMSMKRWRAFLVVSSTNSTFAFTYYFLREYLPDTRWFGTSAFLGYLIAMILAGLLWAGLRYRKLAASDPSVTASPSRRECVWLIGLTLGTVAVLALLGWVFGRSSLFELPGREMTAVGFGLVAATLYTLYRVITCRVDSPSATTILSLSGEAAGLFGLLVFSGAMLYSTWPTTAANAISTTELGEAANFDSAVGPKLVDVQLHSFDEATEVLSGVAVGSEGRIYFGTMKQSGFSMTGSVICADATTGKVVWKFNNDGEMKPVYCTPTVAGGTVFVGEGLHTDSDRKLFALDATTGKPLWNAATTSHTEGTPRIANDRVYFSAGDDGLYCVGTKDGKEVWHFKGSENKLHIDTPPTVHGSRVFFGSGYQTLAILAADVTTGKELWRLPVPLRSFGSPLARGNEVYFGLGTGNLSDELSTEPEVGVPPEKVAKGAVICVNAKTGEKLWQYDLPKSVHTELAADKRTIYACCKDGSLYALDRATGKLRWKRGVGTAFASGPVLAQFANGAATLAVYAVSLEGRAVCLNPTTGNPFWSRDLAEHTKKTVQIGSTPILINDATGAKRTLTFGGLTENKNNGSKTAVVVKIQDEIEE